MGSGFNPRARVGRDARAASSHFSREVFQSTRPRGARLENPSSKQATTLVSIHAPAWGATDGVDVKSIMEHLFQSTRPRGARRQRSDRERRFAFCFNPRARVGRDTVSTILSEYIAGFNPRARVGRDCVRGSRRGLRGRFQSTRPRGARRHNFKSADEAVEFQSTRPRGARRGAGEQQRRGTWVSIHAPAWGATRL